VTDRRDPSPDLERALIRYMAEQRISRRMLLDRMAKLGAAAALAPIVAACSAAAPASSAPPSQAAATPSSAATPVPTATPAPTPVPTPEKELFVYNWDSYIDDHTIEQFQAKYGIKVKYDKFPDASTQMTTLRKDGKGGGFDVSYPASTEIPGLVADGVIRELDLSLIPNVRNLGPDWTNPEYDPGNKHSVPNYWWTTGIAWDPGRVKQDVTSWAALWDAQYKGHLGMLDDVQEVFAVAAFRLGFDANTTDDAQLDQALDLLKQQKPLLRTYTEDDIGDVTSGQLWMSHAWSGDWVQMTYDKPNIKYVIPSEGAVRGSDTMVVTSGAKHPIAAHLWIDFNLDAKISAANSNYTGYMGPNLAAQQDISKDILENPNLNPDKATFDKLTELVTHPPADLDKYTRRWNALRA
jgi:spermidine/putrescine-binding protein